MSAFHSCTQLHRAFFCVFALSVFSISLPLSMDFTIVFPFFCNALCRNNVFWASASSRDFRQSLFSFSKAVKITHIVPYHQVRCSLLPVQMYAWLTFGISAQLPHVMGLQHLADGNQKRAVKSLSKAIFYCYLHDLKWELVRAAHDLKVRCELSSAHVVFLCSTHICHQHADASAVSSDELAAISRIPDNFLECPGSRPLILRLEVHALPCCSGCPLTVFFVLSATILDAKVYN